MGWIVTALGLYLMFVAFLTVMQRQMMYYPSAGRPDPAAYGIAGLSAVTVETADGLTLTHWYRPPQSPEAPVVALFHGNAGHIGDRVGKFQALFRAGFGVFLVEYRGYGGNPGSPSEEGLTEDARSALDWLAGQGIAPARTFLYGESLGTAPAIRMAAARAREALGGTNGASGGPYAGLILEAPFTAIADVAQHHYWYAPVRWLIYDAWEVADDIDEIAAPLLVIHGKRDNTVPFKYGQRLFELAAEPKEALFLPDASHNNLFADPQVPARIVAFVRDRAGSSVPTAAD